MPRVVRVVENVLRVQAGQLPSATAPFWYSGRGSDAPAGDGGGPGGAPAEGHGLAVDGFHADVHALHVVVDAWDPGATGLELTAEVNRSTGGSVEWATLDHPLDAGDGKHVDVKPLRLRLLRADVPAPGQAVTVHVAVVASRLRWGVRALGAGTETMLHAAHVMFATRRLAPGPSHRDGAARTPRPICRAVLAAQTTSANPPRAAR